MSKKIKDDAYYLSLDRRTKEYKQWRANYETSNGVGDKIETFTKLTGIQAVVKRLFGEDCGCDERQENINKMFGKPVKPLTEEEYLFLHNVINGSNKIKPKEQLRMKDIYERIFNVVLKTNCLGCSFKSKIYNPLTRVFDKYTQ